VNGTHIHGFACLNQINEDGESGEQTHYFDEDTGLHYNFFRHYEPDAGWGNPLGLSISTVIHMGKKGKHIAEHNNFIPGRSILTANPQDLLEVVLIRIQEMRLRQNVE